MCKFILYSIENILTLGAPSGVTGIPTSTPDSCCCDFRPGLDEKLGPRLAEVQEKNSADSGMGRI
jgi:hypothetical protein